MSDDKNINPLAPELNPSAQRCLPRFFTGILIFKGLTARRLYKSFGVKGLMNWTEFVNRLTKVALCTDSCAERLRRTTDNMTAIAVLHTCVRNAAGSS
jgi:hypothetical protein